MNKLDTKLFLCALALMVVVIGGFINMHAVIQNGGRMPVQNHDNMVLEIDTPTHFTFNQSSEVKAYPLTDKFRWILKRRGEVYIFSLGDVIIYLGYAFVLIMGIVMLITGIRKNV